MKKTKIICTAPESGDYETLKEMQRNGMDVIRVDLSTSSHDFAKDIVSKIRKMNKEENTSVGILFDTKGPHIKVGEFKDGSIELKENAKVLLTPKDVDGVDNKINISEKKLFLSLDIDYEILLGDGNIKLVVTGIKNEDITCKVVNGGILYSNSSLSVPEVDLNVDYLSIVDKKDILFASKLDVDYISLSFVRNANDILDVNDIFIGERNEHIGIISKIENNSALEDLENIIKVSEGIMFSRDSFSSEIEKLPAIESKIVTESRKKNKLCIISTEMLDSMIDKELPSKIDASEVSYKVVDKVDALLLNKACNGIHPALCVKVMSKIIEETEKNMEYNITKDSEKMDTTTALSYAAVSMANMMDIKAIVTSSISGYTARKVSNFRPRCITIVTTPDKEVAQSLSLNWGVIPVVTERASSMDDIIDTAKKSSKKILNLEKGNKIIVTGGFPLKRVRGTNFIKIEEI